MRARACRSIVHLRDSAVASWRTSMWSKGFLRMRNRSVWASSLPSSSSQE